MSVPDVATEAGWRRLSPRMLVVHPLHEVMQNAPALLALLIAGSVGDGNGHLWSLAGLAVTVVLGITRWFTTTYRVTGEHVQVRSGLLTRKVLTVPRDRVRTVDVTSRLLHRVLGLARVKVGTGTTDRKPGGQVTLDALTAAEAARLRAELLHRRNGTLPGPATPETSPETTSATAEMNAETELARLRPAWIRFAPFTLSGLVTVGVVANFLSQLSSESGIDITRMDPIEAGGQWFRGLPTPAQVALIVLVLVAFVTVASVGAYVLSFWSFRLTRDNGTLHVSRGLLTTRATTIEERRLRGLEVSEPLLMRPLGGAKLTAVTTGLGSTRSASMLMPPAPRDEVETVAHRVLTDGHDRSPLAAPVLPHSAAALRRRFTRAYGVHAMIVAALLAGWAWFGLPAGLWMTMVALLPATALLAVDRYRSLGHALVSGYLVTRWGSLSRRRVVLQCGGVIGWNIQRSFWQRRAGLVTLVATTAAGRQGYGVQDVELPEALRLASAAAPGLLDPFLAHTGARTEESETADHGPGRRPPGTVDA